VSTQSILNSAVTALVSTWRADTTLAALVTAGTLRIFDGPAVDDRTAPIELWVGARGDDDDDAVRLAEYDWETLGQAGLVTEVVEVDCLIWAADGTTDIPAQRANCQTVFDAAAGAVRGGNLGLAPVMWCLARPGVAHPAQTEDGAEMVLPFTVVVRSQL
jgi:hypothetical protein